MLAGALLRECLELLPWLEFLSSARLVCKAWHQVAWTGKHFWVRVYVKNSATERQLARDILQGSELLARLPTDRTPEESLIALARFVESVHVRGLCCAKTRAHLAQLADDENARHNASPEARLDLLIAAEPKGCCPRQREHGRSVRNMLRILDSVPESLARFRLYTRIVTICHAGTMIMSGDEQHFDKAAQLARQLRARNEIDDIAIGRILLGISRNYASSACPGSAERYSVEALPFLARALETTDDALLVDALLVDYENAVFNTLRCHDGKALRRLVDARRARYDRTDRLRYVFMWNAASYLAPKPRDSTPVDVMREARELRLDLLREVHQVNLEVLGTGHPDTQLSAIQLDELL
jgi:hypothetical protein